MLKLEDDFKVTFVFDKPDEEESNEKELLVSAPEVASCPVRFNYKTDRTFYICTSIKKFRKENVTFALHANCLIRKFL